jgi:hypothetical protein
MTIASDAHIISHASGFLKGKQHENHREPAGPTPDLLSSGKSLAWRGDTDIIPGKSVPPHFLLDFRGNHLLMMRNRVSGDPSHGGGGTPNPEVFLSNRSKYQKRGVIL